MSNKLIKRMTIDALFIALIIIRITKFKVVDNKLIVKQKAKE